MDGYAVRAEDVRGATIDAPVALRVVDTVAAGVRSTRELAAGEAIRIMTGAPVPDGADAVVMVEVTEPDPASGDGVLIRRAVNAGDSVRPAGGDVEPGTLVFPKGTVLTPAHIGVLASLGFATVDVVRRARVGVLSTGDELTPPGEALVPGRIRDSNRPMVLALVAAAGCDPVDLGIARDDEQVITAAIEGAVSSCDALITSGGVSVGDYDFVKAVLDRLGKMQWFQIAIRPAKPFAFGMVGSVPVFGLPGNPVSSLVSFELFARPALRLMMGHAPGDCERPVVRAVAGEPLRRKPDGKLHLDRVRVARDGDRLVARRTGGQASNVLSAMAAANALTLLPDGDGVDEGEPLDVMLLE